LTAAVAADPTAIMPRQLLGQIYLDRKEYNRAAAQFDKLTTLDPYTEENFYQLGYCQQLLGQLPKAIASYKQALALDDKDAKAATNLGVVYLSLNKPHDAAKLLDQATKADDRSWYAWASYGIALDSLNKYSDGEEAYRRSLELDPSQTSTMYNLAGNLMEQHRAAEAAPVLAELLKHGDTAPLHKKYADALAFDNPTLAAAEYRKTLQIDPKYLPAINSLASLLIQQYEKEMEFDENKKTSAIELWRKSLAISPNQPDITAALKKWTGK
jgi:superkiller protein 3